MDAAVSGQLDLLAREMEAEGFGRAVLLSGDPPRVYRIAGRREVDVAEIEGETIEDDLGRRDFTVNAMAFDLADRAWIDPFGGRQALAAGRLRAVSPKNLRDDPLRVLRAARFIATHGLRPDAATSRLCRAAAPGLAGVAEERIRAEWVKLIESPRVQRAIEWAARSGVLAPALRIEGDESKRLERSAAGFDEGAIRRIAPISRRRVRLALLCARLRIPPAKTAAWLAARRYGRSEAGEAAALLRLSEAAATARGDLSMWDWVRDSGALAAEALVLFSVLHPRQAARLRALRHRIRRARRRGPRVTGEDLMRWTGRPPGPEIGRLLSRLQTEVLRGRVRTRREARTWLFGQGTSTRSPL